MSAEAASTPGRVVVRVFHSNKLAPIDRGNGVRSIPLASEETGSRALLTGMTLIPRGGAIPPHIHSSDECVVVLEGRAACEVADERHQLAPFDATYISSGVQHRFVNTGDTDLRILWVYDRTDTTRTLVETGETTGHLGTYGGRGER